MKPGEHREELVSNQKREQRANARVRRHRAVLTLKIAAGELSPSEAEAALEKLAREDG